MNLVFMSNRFKEIKNIMRHRKVLQRIAKEKGYSLPEKPLNAYDTWVKYYSDIDMEDTLKLLGFWRE